MADQKEFTCKECGETFDSLADIGHHARETGHVNKKPPKIQRGGQGSPKTESLLTDEDLLELKEKEKLIRMKELELREAQLDAKLSALKNSGSGNSVSDSKAKERIWILPDGSTFKGTKDEFQVVSENFQVAIAAQGRKNNGNSDSESFSMKLLDLYKQDTDRKIGGLNYSAFDALEQALPQLDKFSARLGYSPAGVQNPSDKMKMDLFSTELSAVNKGIDRLSTHMDRAESDRRFMLRMLQKEFATNPELKKRLFPGLSTKSPFDLMQGNTEPVDPADLPRVPMSEDEANQMLRNMQVQRKHSEPHNVNPP